jgi:RNA polymerase sigma-70 factor, ECF subfamily
MVEFAGAPNALLAQRAADGDVDAFAELVRRHAPFLRAFATRLTGSAVEADDCVQEALIVAWRRLPDLADLARVRSWLTTIVSRKATDRLRARRPLAPLDELELVEAADTPEERVEMASQIEALRVALATIPEEQRTVWLLKEVGGQSYEEIAEQVGASVTAVRGRLARARRAVLTKMGEWR